MYRFSKVYKSTIQLVLVLNLLSMFLKRHFSFASVARAVQTIMVEFDHNMPVKAKQRTWWSCIIIVAPLLLQNFIVNHGDTTSSLYCWAVEIFDMIVSALTMITHNIYMYIALQWSGTCFAWSDHILHLLLAMNGTGVKMIVLLSFSYRNYGCIT